MHNTSIDILKATISTVTSPLVGIVLLILALFTVPRSWIIFIIRYIQPSLLKAIFNKYDKYFLSILSILLHSNYTEDYKDDGIIRLKMDKIRRNKEDLDKIESNMFTIDLLQDLFGTLQFTIGNVSAYESVEIIDQIINYFNHYCQRLDDTSYRKNFASDILKQFSEMSHNIKETIDINGHEGTVKEIKSMYTNSFAKYLKEEKASLISARELLLNSIKDTAIEVMGESK